MLICALRSVNFTWAQAQVCPGVASLVPRLPPFFCSSVFIQHTETEPNTERKPKNKKRGRPGNQGILGPVPT